MTINLYQVGDLVRISGAFTDTSDAPQDPSALSLFVTAPNGITTEYVYGTDVEVVKDSTGNYHADIDADLAGDWRYRWVSSGTGQASQFGQFVVEARPL